MSNRKHITVAVAGNPNCGKTTVFNGLTGSSLTTGNWPGVTIEKQTGFIKGPDCDITLVDLPGIYALSADSEDERVSRDYLIGGEVDLVLNVLDATNPERNLYLTLQILELGLPVAAVFTMADLADRRGVLLDTGKFTQLTGIPSLSVNATRKGDLDRLSRFIHEVTLRKEPAEVRISRDFPPVIEEGISRLSDSSGVDRWTALKLIEGDAQVTKSRLDGGIVTQDLLNEVLGRVSEKAGDEPDILIAQERYEKISRITSFTVGRIEKRPGIGGRLDAVVMHRFWGIPIFLGAMFLTFWFTASVGGAFIDFFDILFGSVFVDGTAALLGRIGAPEWVIGVLANGVGAGIQTVSTFIPVIAAMFLILSMLEDSGYMARAAFVMDRLMRLLGLPGKSFVPMLIGFGCTVPAIMATRTLENRRDRIMTVFMAPLMSCGARLPVYALFGAAFFGRRSGLVVFSIYMTGILLAVLTGLLLKKTLFRGEFSPFIMELPPWHAPRPRQVLRATGFRLKAFVFKAGKIILPAVAVLAILNTFSFKGTTGHEDSQDSILARVGQTITPVFHPMGIVRENWPATVGLFTGIFAKEAVVGTLNSLYSAGSSAADAGISSEPETAGRFFLVDSLLEALAVTGDNLKGVWEGLLDPLGLGIVSADESAVAEAVEADAATFVRMRENFTPAAAYAFLLFTLIYMPCMAASGAALREIGKGFGSLLLLYLSVLAWIVATLFYQVAEGHNLWYIALASGLLGVIILAFALAGRNSRKDVKRALSPAAETAG